MTKLLKFDGPNMLEVTVAKHSANESVNRAERTADYWVFGGIYRPVYLEAVPQEFIDRVAIDAQADGPVHHGCVHRRGGGRRHRGGADHRPGWQGRWASRSTAKVKTGPGDDRSQTKIDFAAASGRPRRRICTASRCG